MKALIMSGGAFPDKRLLLDELKDTDIIIGVDRGINFLYKNNVIPNIILGDFDSVNKTFLNNYIREDDIEVINFPAEKDYTDTQYAVDKCIELAVDEITLLGCTGSRIDHTLGNIGLLYKCLTSGIKACIKDNNNTLFMKNRDFTLKEKQGSFFSLNAYAGNVTGLTITNAKYELGSFELSPWDPISVSNEFVGKDVDISFNSGVLIVSYVND